MDSAANLKTRFRSPKSDVKTKRDRCGTSRHLNGKCLPLFHLEDSSKIEEMLWHRERYRQSQLFTATHEMRSINDLHNKKRK